MTSPRPSTLFSSDSDTPPVAVVAIGGNSLITDNKDPSVPRQWDAVRETTRNVADMVEAGWTVVVTHGNGPQVGFILRRNELAAAEVHPTPLDLIVADTQGSIGFMLQQTLNNEFFQRKISRQCITLITQVRVEADDRLNARDRSRDLTLPQTPVRAGGVQTPARTGPKGGRA